MLYPFTWQYARQADDFILGRGLVCSKLLVALFHPSQGNLLLFNLDGEGPTWTRRMPAIYTLHMPRGPGRCGTSQLRRVAGLGNSSLPS